MIKHKSIIFDLRKEGKSYSEIQKEFKISRSTLCAWFKDEDWSKHIKKSNIKKNLYSSTERIIKMNIVRAKMLEIKYNLVEKEAREEFFLYKNKPLFNAGLMLYAGEGDRLDKGTIRLANVDFMLHKIFINFAKEFLKVNHSDIKFSVLLYPDLDVNTCVERWSKELNIVAKNIYKPQIIKGRSKTRKLHFGVGTSIILNSFLKRKLMIWIEEIKKSLSSD